jgi:chromate transporter
MAKDIPQEESPINPIKKPSAWEVFRVSFLLGLTSFGGPAAHIGYFREEYVARRRWLNDRDYADLVALCQFLPGPSSSQVGMGVGLLRAGYAGALAAWIGFTLPSAAAMALFALMYQSIDISSAGWLHGLKLAAVAIIAHAVLGMGRTLAPDRPRAAVAIAAAAALLLWPAAYMQLAVIAAAGLFGWARLQRSADAPPARSEAGPVSRRAGIAALALFAVLLAGLPLLRQLAPSSTGIAIADSFYRVGALVFGGGHVILPLLEQEAVPAGWVNAGQFLAGYGAAQAVPGPLFTFAAYIGVLAKGWAGAAVALAAIFAPAFLLLAGAMPFWHALRTRPAAQGILAGVNAGVVGILLAALYHPVWTGTVQHPADFALALIVFAALAFWKLPPWAAVLIAALGGMVLPLFV